MSSQLYSPMFIGNVKIKNRLVMPAINLSYATAEGHVTSRVVDFYTARAKGGAGLIVIGAVGVDPDYVSPAGVLQLSSDDFVRGMTTLTDSIHAAGSKCFAQLWHPGAYARSDEYGKTAVAPSAITSGFTRETPRELTVSEIKKIVKLFGKAAERAKLAGFDGIELCGNSGYLISQFLSAKTNNRDDIYGGYEASERIRFLKEIITAVRRSIGPDYPITVRLAGNEFVSGGNGINDCIAIAKQLENLSVCALSITGGWHETNIPQLTMDVPSGAFVYLARMVKRNVSIPVIACNRLNVKTAEKVIDDGDADFAAIGRGFIADPELGNKGMTGEYSLIRPCIGCNQGCMDHIFRMKPLSCLANPDAYSESMSATKARGKRILVVGAGPAGLEFARIAALSGHKVTVREAEKKAGGMLNLASATAGRKDFLKLVDWLVNSCIDAGVRFEFGVRMEGSDIASSLRYDYDHVVLATGSVPKEPDFPISSEASVFNARQVLSGNAEVGHRVLIVGSNATAVETALFLSEAGTIDADTLRFLTEHNAESPELLRQMLFTGNRQISLLVRHNKLGRDIGPSTRWAQLAALKRRGIDTITMDSIVLLDEGCVKIKVNGVIQRVECDSVVLCIGSESSIPEFDEDAYTGRVTVIGDAENVGKLDAALLSAHKAAVEI